MKKCLLVLISIVVLCSCENDNIRTEFYPNGNVKSEIEIKNGVNHGQAKGYYESGKLKYIENWIEGKVSGTVQYFYENGTTQHKTEWIDNKRNGVSKEYQENGVLWSKSIYKDDQIIFTELLYPDGSVLERQKYNELNEMIYFAKLDSTGFKYLEAAMPLIKAEKDTIELGEEYRVHISFGLDMKGYMNVYTGKMNDNKELIDSINVDKLNNFEFSYTFIPDKVGQGVIPFVFEHETDDSDSLKINNFKHRKTYHVEPSSEPMI